MSFVDSLTAVINKHSVENGSNTPDFILAGFLRGCLIAWENATNARSRWYGHIDAPPGIHERIGDKDKQIAKLLSQLPEGMKHCTIRVISCPHGHTRLTADNWLDPGCRVCEVNNLHLILEEKERTILRFKEMWQSGGE